LKGFLAGGSGVGFFEIREKRDEIRDKRGKRRQAWYREASHRWAMAFYCH
jgi:hypothetical protein